MLQSSAMPEKVKRSTLTEEGVTEGVMIHNSKATIQLNGKSEWL